MINVQICCNDDYGNHTGRVIRFDFDLYELEVEDTLWPPRGVRMHVADNATGSLLTFPSRVKFGRDTWRPAALGGGGGNIYWRVIRMSGVDCIGLMNYLMRLKYWHATAGECYLFDRFNGKKPIVPRDFFASRQEQTEGYGLGTHPTGQCTKT